jgi:hypothetical protein
MNAIRKENQKQGTSAWQILNPADAHGIESYASLTSVNRGREIKLFVNTTDSRYTIDFFRMGWYGGLGARHVKGPIQRKGTIQTFPNPDPETGLIECK